MFSATSEENAVCKGWVVKAALPEESRSSNADDDIWSFDGMVRGEKSIFVMVERCHFVLAVRRFALRKFSRKKELGKNKICCFGLPFLEPRWEIAREWDAGDAGKEQRRRSVR